MAQKTSREYFKDCQLSDDVEPIWMAGWLCAMQSIAEAGGTDKQQLKAEIAALIKRFEINNPPGLPVHTDWFINALRQLSAV